MAARITTRPPATLTAEELALYEEISGGPRSSGPQHFPLTNPDGSLRGPFNAMLLSPPLGSALQSLGARIRYRGALTDRAREIAVLVVAAHWDCEFERASHEAVARAIGLTEDQLRAIRAGDSDALEDEDRLIARVASQLAGGNLDDDLWADAVAALGPERIFELTTLVGYYAMLALQLRVFRVES